MDKNNLKKQIQDQIAELSSSIADLKISSQPVAPDPAIGRLTRMEMMQTQKISENALKKAQLKLEKLQQALTNIDDPEFGICQECGKQIPSGRILAMPESPICVICAEEIE